MVLKQTVVLMIKNNKTIDFSDFNFRECYIGIHFTPGGITILSEPIKNNNNSYYKAKINSSGICEDEVLQKILNNRGVTDIAPFWLLSGRYHEVKPHPYNGYKIN